MTDSILNRKMNWNGVEFAIMDLVQKGASDSLVADTTTLAYMLVRKVAWDNCEQISQIQSEQVYVSNSVGPKTVRRLKTISPRLTDIGNVGSVTMKISQ